MSRRARASDGQLEASGGRDADVNRERLVFFLISCVGRRVTAKLRNNVTYEGILTSCACNTDCSLTLDNARQKGPDGVESEVISTMVVPGKSWMSVYADDVQSPQSFADTANLSNMHQGMQQADGEAAQRQVPGEDGAEERQEGARDQQHELDSQLGIAKVVDESIVTTPLEQSEIPAEKRKQAERLARELQEGIAQSETEGRAEGEEAEEDETERNGKVSKNASALLPVTAKAAGLELAHHDRQTDAWCPSGEGTRDQRVSEMKRINALNLEPAFQKPEKNRMPPKQQASRVARPPQTELKAEFQQSLEAITSQAAKRGSLSATTKAFQMNPNAKAFTLAGSPPSALHKAPPTGPPAPQQAAVPVPKQTAAAPAQQKSTDKPSMPLVDILDQFFQRAREENPESQRLDWPEAKGPSYREVLGQPTQNMVPGPWPPQQPGQQPPMQAQLPMQQQQPPQQQPFGHQQHQQPQQNPQQQQQQQLPQQLQPPQQPQQQQQPLQQQPHRQQPPQPQPQQQPPQPQQQPQQQPRQQRGQQQQPPPQQQQPQQPQQPQNQQQQQPQQQQPPPQQQPQQQQPQQQQQQQPLPQQQPPQQQQQQQPQQQPQQQQPPPQQQQQPQQMQPQQMQPPQPQQPGGAMDPMHTGMAFCQDPRTGQMQPMYPPQMFPPQGAQMMPQRPPNDGSQAQMPGQPGMVFSQTQMMHPAMMGGPDNRQPTGPGMTMGLPAGFPTGPQQMMVMPVMLAPGTQYGQSGSGFVTQTVPGQPDQASLKQCSG